MKKAILALSLAMIACQPQAKIVAAPVKLLSCVKLFGHCNHTDDCCGDSSMCTAHHCWTMKGNIALWKLADGEN